MNKLFAFVVLLIALLTFSKGAISEIYLKPSLRITNECVECLKKHNVPPNSALKTLKPGMIINEDTLIALVENDNRNLLRNLISINSYFTCFRQLIPNIRKQSAFETEDSTTLEDELFFAIFKMETPCGYEIGQQFNSTRQDGINCVCDKKGNDEKGCFPPHIRQQVKNHFNNKCRKRMGKDVF